MADALGKCQNQMLPALAMGTYQHLAQRTTVASWFPRTILNAGPV
jgi:hypothetical protein